jgi:hypothetical protein
MAQWRGVLGCQCRGTKEKRFGDMGLECRLLAHLQWLRKDTVGTEFSNISTPELNWNNDGNNAKKKSAQNAGFIFAGLPSVALFLQSE